MLASPKSFENMVLHRPRWVIGMGITSVAIAVVTLLGPTERVLGTALRLVLLHGAWVWVGKMTYALAGLAGLVFWLTRRPAWAERSTALGWTALFIWSTYLPMSLYLQISIWGGVFWEEPRWRVPLMLWGVSLAFQVAGWLMREPRVLTFLNAVFAALLWWQLGATGTILHPQSPVFGGEAVRIQVHFVLLVLLCGLLMLQITAVLIPAARRLFVHLT
ncbi:MAG: hypothetical protein N3A60_08230 [Thermanaerothrix sp.]|nr:hypothetical protein [Thermanaerothrix sp.]